jgi:hypothetical protein
MLHGWQPWGGGANGKPQVPVDDGVEPLWPLARCARYASGGVRDRALSVGELSLNEPWTGRRTVLYVQRAHQPKTGGPMAKEMTSMQEIRRYQVYRVRQRHRPWLLARLRRIVRLTAARGLQQSLAAQTKVRDPQLAAPDLAGC